MAGDNDDVDNGAPPAFVVYYNPIIHMLKLVTIAAICVVLALLPLLVDNVRGDAVLVIGAFIVILLVWAYLSFARIRDQRPQVVVDADGIYVRDWHIGVVPWENIDFIAHSSSVRRGIVSALTRSRRGPYLLFKFVETPAIVPSWPASVAWLQKFWVEMELQEPVIMQYGLNAKASALLRAIQAHIAYWQRSRDTDAGEPAIVSPDME